MPAEIIEPMSEASRLEQFLARTSARDRVNIEKHLLALDGETDANHGKVWRRLATFLADLAPMPMQMVGQYAVLYFIADGKYKMQVFSLEDRRDGSVVLYLPDVLEEALSKKIIRRAGEEGFESGSGGGKHVVRLSLIGNDGISDPQPHVKQMLGWNRKALRIAITAFEFEGPVLETAEALCELAASKFPKPAKK